MNKFSRTPIGKPAQWLIEAAAAVNLNISELTHEITNHFKNHVMNRHGDPRKHGTATITESDFTKIPGILAKPDILVIGAVRWEIPCNVYVKIEDGISYLYFEDILDSSRNKCLRGRTFYKVTRPLTLDEVISNIIRNDKTDISKAKIITFPKG